MGLREKQKSRRRRQILDAARALVRSNGSTDFSMRQLAEDAEVSLVTPYNLFGSKSGILYALLDDSLERLGRADDSESADGASEDVFSLAGIAARDYTGDAHFFRPLLQHLLGVPDPEHRPRLMARSLERWTRNVEAASDAGLLAPGVDVDILARQLLITFIGTVELWIHGELDDAGFVAQSLYGSTLLVQACVADAARPQLVARLEAAAERLPRQLAAPGAAPESSSESHTTAA